MTAPRPVTPPQAIRAVPATPLRAVATPSPWDLAELPAPAAPPPPDRSRQPHHGNYTPAEVAHLREEMQAQHVRALADARRQAFEEGRVAGRADAQQAADQRVADAVNALHAAITGLREHEESYVGVLEENLTALACAIARQVIQREVQLDPSAIRELVHAAVTEFPQDQALRVRLNPQDHALLAGESAFRDVTWVQDPRIVRGGCVVEGRERIIDGRVDIAIEAIFRALTGLDA
ncbi:MAG: hypothetical protein K1X31_04945 [Gemmatimonadaceae bacterium]|nr:hypothetical protein [Gemmatimonadaceae bacterium]